MTPPFPATAEPVATPPADGSVGGATVPTVDAIAIDTELFTTFLWLPPIISLREEAPTPCETDEFGSLDDKEDVDDTSVAVG